MNYATVCSGIEAPSNAWDSLGWTPQWFSQFDPEHNYKSGLDFPSRVLKHHFPDVANLGNMTTIHESETFKQSAIDVLCGGTPCQSFSVAGLRKGLDDPRGNLMLTFLALADRKRPKWILWENVPGVLSSNKGRDFGAFLGGLAELGYGWAYRVLDAQYYGVAQRRRRVFVVGCLGDYRRAAAVLFERHSLSGYPAPSREKGKEITNLAGTLAANGGGLNRADWNANELDFCVVDTAPTLRAGGNRTGGDRPPGTDVDTVESLIAVFDPNQITSKANRSQPTPELCHTLPATPNSPVVFGVQNSASQGLSYSEHVTPTLDKSKIPAVAFSRNEAECYNPEQPQCWRVFNPNAIAPTLQSGEGRGNAILNRMAVRRLTPVECERLQGFADSYTDIRPNGKPTPDGPRYKALGNSMAVPVIKWLGQRIQLIDDLTP